MLPYMAMDSDNSLLAPVKMDILQSVGRRGGRGESGSGAGSSGGRVKCHYWKENATTEETQKSRGHQRGRERDNTLKYVAPRWIEDVKVSEGYCQQGSLAKHKEEEIMVGLGGKVRRE